MSKTNRRAVTDWLFVALYTVLCWPAKAGNPSNTNDDKDWVTVPSAPITIAPYCGFTDTEIAFHLAFDIKWAKDPAPQRYLYSARCYRKSKEKNCEIIKIDLTDNVLTYMNTGLGKGAAISFDRKASVKISWGDASFNVDLNNKKVRLDLVSLFGDTASTEVKCN